MNLLDVVVIAALVSAALGGFRVGFLARVASWVGVAIGFYLALRLLPLVLRSFDLPTASAFAGLLVAAGGALVKFYKSRAVSASSPVVPMMPVAPSKVAHEPQIAA